MLTEWREAGVDETECTRWLIDLFLVSVLLDAGAGNEWKFVEPGSGMRLTRSEGLAVASLYMFNEGTFTSDKEKVAKVDGTFYLRNITGERVTNYCYQERH